MFTPIVLALLLVAFLALSWVLSAAETSLTYLSRKEAEGIVAKRPKSPILTVMAQLPEHLQALRFWRIFAETASAVAAALLLDWFLDSTWWSVLTATVLMGFASLLLVVWSPRQVGARHDVGTARATAGLVRLLTRVLGPLPAKFAAPGTRTEDEEEEAAEIEERHFREFVARANDADVLEDAEAELIQSVFDMGDTIVRAVMVPRTDVVTVDAGTTLDDAMNLLLRSGCSRVPLIGESADEVFGMIYLKDVARALHRDRRDPYSPVDEVVREVRFVPESKPVSELLQELQREATHVAIVIDEYGGTAGLVTLEDLIEEIVGDISDEYDQQDRPEVEPVREGLFRVDARMNLDDFAEIFRIDVDDEDDVHTIGGLLAKSLGMVPIQGSEVEVQGLILHAETLEGRRNRVSRLLVRQSEPDGRSIHLEGHDDGHLQGQDGTSPRHRSGEGFESAPSGAGSTTADSREGR